MPPQKRDEAAIALKRQCRAQCCSNDSKNLVQVLKSRRDERSSRNILFRKASRPDLHSSANQIDQNGSTNVSTIIVT